MPDVSSRQYYLSGTSDSRKSQWFIIRACPRLLGAGALSIKQAKMDSSPRTDFGRSTPSGKREPSGRGGRLPNTGYPTSQLNSWALPHSVFLCVLWLLSANFMLIYFKLKMLFIILLLCLRLKTSEQTSLRAIK